MRILDGDLRSSIGTMSVSPDGRWLAAHGGGLPIYGPKKNPVLVWDVQALNAPPTRIPAGKPACVHFLSDGSLLIGDIAIGKETLTRRPFPKRGKVRTLVAGESFFRGFAVTPDESEVWANPTELKRWALADGSPLTNPFFGADDDTFVQGLPVFRPDGRQVAASVNQFTGTAGETLRVWTLADGTEAKRLPSVGTPLYSPDGHWLTVRTPTTVTVWAADTFKKAAVVAPRGGVSSQRPTDAYVISAAFTPDGRRLAVGCFDGLLHLYDAKSWALDRTFDFGRAVTTKADDIRRGIVGVRAVAFTPDGTMGFAACGFKVVAWDVDD